MRGGVRERRPLVRDEPAGQVEQPGGRELGHRVDEAGPAQPHRRRVPDHLELENVVSDPDHLDRSVGGPHAATDLRRLERRAGRCRRAEQPLRRTERDLAVGAHVDEQAQAAVAGHPGGEQSRHDVAADVRAERGEHDRACVRMDRQPELGSRHVRIVVRHRRERRHPDRLRGRCRAPAASWWRCRRAPPRTPRPGRRRPARTPPRPAPAASRRRASGGARGPRGRASSPRCA